MGRAMLENSVLWLDDSTVHWPHFQPARSS